MFINIPETADDKSKEIKKNTCCEILNIVVKKFIDNKKAF